MNPKSKLLNSFTSISLNELINLRWESRTDLKYLVREHDIHNILEDMATKYRMLEINLFRCFDYETIYFDTPVHQMYSDHQRGKRSRCKIRIRKYLQTKDCFLEIKKKTNKNQVVKLRMPHDFHTDKLNDHEQQFILQNSPFYPGELSPKIRVFFNRLTFINTEKTEKVTLDLNLSFQDKNRKPDIPGIGIFEVKKSKQLLKSGFGRIISKYGYFPASFSKYCTGMILLKKAKKYNRFKQNLLTLTKLTGDRKYIETIS